ncbi:MAG: AAA family ATPase [Succinivibrio sp.]|nr:AAA family ATPase [Succinivibrio sp.]
MKKIPIGRSGIKTIVDGNYIYVDKTKEIKFLIDNYDFAFFSRPRRFGKSLTIDTVETLFTYGVDPYFKIHTLQERMMMVHLGGIIKLVLLYVWTFQVLHPLRMIYLYLEKNLQLF